VHDKDIEFIDFRNKHSIFCRRQKFVTKNQHCHAYYEIEIIEKGVGEHIINGNKYRETPGDICLMRLTDFHEFDMEEPGEHWVIEIPPATIPDDIAKLMVFAESDIIAHLNEDDFMRAKMLYQMVEECNNKNDVFYEKTKMHIVCTLILFILGKAEKNFSEKCSKNNIQIREIIAYIQNNLFEDLSAASIASKFFISKEYLSTFFKKNTGITLVSYIRKTRLSYASKLVVTTDKKMLEICELSGFNSLPTFMRAFKSEYGMSPTEMRQEYKKQNKAGGEAL